MVTFGDDGNVLNWMMVAIAELRRFIKTIGSRETLGLPCWWLSESFAAHCHVMSPWRGPSQKERRPSGTALECGIVDPSPRARPS